MEHEDPYAYRYSATPLEIGTIVTGEAQDLCVVSCEDRGGHFLIGLELAALYATDIHGRRLSEIPTGSAQTP